MRNILNKNRLLFFFLAVFVLLLSNDLIYKFLGRQYSPKSPPIKNNNLSSRKTNMELYNVIKEGFSAEDSEFPSYPLLHFKPTLSGLYGLRDISQNIDREKYTHIIYESGLGLDERNHDYFNIYGSKYIHVSEGEQDDGERHLEICSSAILEDKTIYASSPSLLMEKLSLDKCAVSSFLKETNISFFSCVSSFDKERQVADVFIIGFLQVKADGKFGLRPVFYNSVDLSFKKDEKIRLSPRKLAVILVRPYKFYFVTKDTAYLVEKVGNRLILTEGTPLKYYDENYTNENPIPSDLVGQRLSFLPRIEMSPTGRYIYYRGHGGGVLDTTSAQTLSVDKSCFAKTDKEEKPLESKFYNDWVDPFTVGPYKVIDILKWDEVNKVVLLEQTFCSGGGCAREGRIKMYLTGGAVKCDINVRYEPLDLD